MPDPFAQQTIPSAAPRYHQGRKMFSGRYTLLRPLGRGGMGEVWLAQDNELGVQRALKFAPPEIAADARSVAMLKREAIAGTSLAHPNIVRIFDFDHDAAAMESAVVMEVVEGKSLAELQAKRIEETGNGFFEPSEIENWLRDACAALDYAHGEGRVHRDLKPQNLMIETATGRLKIMDFGISRRIGDSFSQLTGKDSSGTLPYMSPQQVMGDKVSPSDDIYALGATLYDLLSGSPPFCGGDLKAQIIEKPPQPIQSRRAELLAEKQHNGQGTTLPPHIERLVLDCMSKERAARPRAAANVPQRFSPPAPEPRRQDTPRQSEKQASSWLRPTLKLATALSMLALAGAALHFLGYLSFPAGKVPVVAIPPEKAEDHSQQTTIPLRNESEPAKSTSKPVSVPTPKNSPDTSTPADVTTTTKKKEAPKTPPSNPVNPTVAASVKMFQQEPPVPRTLSSSSPATANSSTEGFIKLSNDFNNFIRANDLAGATAKYAEIEKRLKDNPELFAYKSKLTVLTDRLKEENNRADKAYEEAIENLNAKEIDPALVKSKFKELCALTSSPNPSAQTSAKSRLAELGKYIEDRFKKTNDPVLAAKYLECVPSKDSTPNVDLPTYAKMGLFRAQLGEKQNQAVALKAAEEMAEKTAREKEAAELQKLLDWEMQIADNVRKEEFSEALSILCAPGWTVWSEEVDKRLPVTTRFHTDSKNFESAQELIDKVGILVGKGMLKKGYMWLGDEKWADDLQDVKNAEMREEITRQVQTKLGLPADGKAGEQTIVAILKLERGNAKEPTGQFSQWLLEKLEVDSGVHKAEPGKQTLSRKSGRK